jgi:PAS domain S-box-containing protein
MLRFTPTATARRYGFAVVAVVTAVIARRALDPWLGGSFPIALLFLAVLVVAHQSGRGPALLATALGGLGAATFLMAPFGSPLVAGFENRAGLVLYAFVGTGIALLGGALREAKGRAEENLEMADRRLQELQITLDSIGDGVLVTDAEGRVVSLNPAAEELTGWRSAEASGQPLDLVFTIVNEATRAPVDNPASRALREGTIVGLANHTILLARDGVERPIDDCAAPIRDRSGRVSGAVLVFRDVGEARRAEAELRRAGDRARSILGSITDAFCALDRDWRFTFVNPQAEALLGLSAAELIGRSHWDVYPNLVGSEVEREYRRALTEDVSVAVEFFYEPHDRWYDAKAYPSPEGLSVYFRDVTDRKQAEERERRLMAEAAAANARFRAFFEQGALFAGLMTVEGVVIETNRLAVDGCGYTREEVVGRPFWECPYWSGSPELVAKIREAVAVARLGETYRAELPFFVASGEERVVDLILLPIKDEQGEVAFLAPTGTDVTDRHRAELTLRRSEGWFRDLASALPQIVWISGPDHEVEFYNDRWFQYTGLTPEEAYQESGWRQQVHPDDIPTLIEANRKADLTGQPFEAEYRLKDRFGAYRWHLGRAVDVLDESGTVVRRFGTTTDIDDRKRAEGALRAARDEAEEANRAKTQFLAVLSHELRTPLNPILLAASSMLDQPCEPEEIRPTLEMIRQNVSLQARLIDDLLDVMRIVRNKMSLHREVADCHVLIEHAIAICRADIDAGGLRLDLDLTAVLHHVNVDPARWQQVIWNLIKNAVKFTPRGGTVAVRTSNGTAERSCPATILVEVADTGIGIAPDVLPRIFEPFQQGETTITRKFGGLGLGLAISKGIVEGHGGTLQATSPGQGMGTTFRVELPALSEPHAQGNGHAQGWTNGQPPTSPRRILLVEDEPATLRLMARLLKGLGHTVTTADTVASAIEQAESREFDLIVSDIGLPDGTGLEMMRRIVALRGPIPSIALTGFGMESDILRSFEAGFSSHMTKPIDFRKLEAEIRRVVAGGEPGAAQAS